MKVKKLLLTMAALCGFFIASHAQATCSNFSTYVDGQVLTASSLNSLQTNYTNCVNAVLDGDTFTGNMLWHSGSDALFYSDTGTTLKAAIYGDGAGAIVPQAMPGETWNCGISNSGTTFTIAGSDGTALSATNPCVIGIKSTTAGRTAIAYFTSNVTFTHGATSNTDGNLWGLAAADWANVMPFFLGVVYDGTTPYFTIGRKPADVTGAAATDVCQKDDVDCDGVNDVMILTTGLTLANWASKPITQVGWFDMTFANTNSAWTAAVSAQNGFNQEYEKKKFTFPQAQSGCGGTAPAAGTHILTAGGTVPQFTTENADYGINRYGKVSLNIYYDADAGTDGAGAVQTSFALPYEGASSMAAFMYLGTFQIQAATTLGNAPFYFGHISAVTTQMDFIYNSAVGVATGVTHALFSNGARLIKGNIEYNTLAN